MSGSLEIPFQNRLFKIRGNADPLSQLRKHHSVDTIQISRSIRRTGADRGIDRKLSRAQPLPDMSETFPGMFQKSLGIRVIPQVLVKCNVFQNIFDFITNLSDCVPDSCKKSVQTIRSLPGSFSRWLRRSRFRDSGILPFRSRLNICGRCRECRGIFCFDQLRRPDRFRGMFFCCLLRRSGCFLVPCRFRRCPVCFLRLLYGRII